MPDGGVLPGQWRIRAPRRSGARGDARNRCPGPGHTPGPRQPGRATASCGRLRPPPAACGRLRPPSQGPAGAAAARGASVMRSQPAQCSTGPAWCGPMFHRTGPGGGPGAARCSNGPLRSGPGPAREPRPAGGQRADTFSRSALMPQLASRYRRWRADQGLIAASRVSRRGPQASSGRVPDPGVPRSPDQLPHTPLPRT
jgi:hypothetical protein